MICTINNIDDVSKRKGSRARYDTFLCRTLTWVTKATWANWLMSGDYAVKWKSRYWRILDNISWLCVQENWIDVIVTTKYFISVSFCCSKYPCDHVHWQTFILSSNFSKFHFPSSSVTNRVSDDLKMGCPAEFAVNAITGDDDDDDVKSNTLLGIVISNKALRAPLSSKQLQFIWERIPIWLQRDH